VKNKIRKQLQSTQ